MQLPSWLASLSGANKFANNPANGFGATLGDLAQAAGHSMLQHYRGKGGTYGAGGGPDKQAMLAGLSAGPIQGSPLPPAMNAAPAPEPAPITPEAQAALTAQLNGAQPWGRLPLAQLAATGLRMF